MMVNLHNVSDEEIRTILNRILEARRNNPELCTDPNLNKLFDDLVMWAVENGYHMPPPEDE